MVELAVYTSKDLGSVILPRVIAKTVDLQRISIDVPEGFTLSKSVGVDRQSNTSSKSDLDPEKRFYIQFWNELFSELSFDDPGQPLPSPSRSQNLFLHPSINKRVWVSAYFMKSKKKVGVY